MEEAKPYTQYLLVEDSRPPPGFIMFISGCCDLYFFIYNCLHLYFFCNLWVLFYSKAYSKYPRPVPAMSGFMWLGWVEHTGALRGVGSSVD